MATFTSINLNAAPGPNNIRTVRFFRCSKCGDRFIARHKVIAPSRRGNGVVSWCIHCTLEDVNTWYHTAVWNRKFAE